MAEGLQSRCDILGYSTVVVLGISASVLAREPLHHFGQWTIFWLQPRTPVKLQRELRVPFELQQVIRGSFRVVVELPRELQWADPLQ